MSSDLKKDPLVDSFLSSLRLEKGLSENTIKAYSNDCQAFKKWLFLTQKTPTLGTLPRLKNTDSKRGICLSTYVKSY